MKRPLRLRRLPAILFATTVMFELVAVMLSTGLEPLYDTLVYATYTITLAGAGALIASRHRRNPIGWLFCGIAMLNAIAADTAQGWGLRAAANSWPGGPLAECIALVSWIPSAPATVLTFLLFPDGRAPRKGWLAVPGWAQLCS